MISLVVDRKENKVRKLPGFSCDRNKSYVNKKKWISHKTLIVLYRGRRQGKELSQKTFITFLFSAVAREKKTSKKTRFAYAIFLSGSVDGRK